MIQLSASNGYSYNFFKRLVNHPTFNDKSARDFMLENNSIDDFLKIKNYFRSKVII